MDWYERVEIKRQRVSGFRVSEKSFRSSLRVARRVPRFVFQEDSRNVPIMVRRVPHIFSSLSTVKRSLSFLFYLYHDLDTFHPNCYRRQRRWMHLKSVTGLFLFRKLRQTGWICNTRQVDTRWLLLTRQSETQWPIHVDDFSHFWTQLLLCFFLFVLFLCFSVKRTGFCSKLLGAFRQFLLRNIHALQRAR